MVMTALRYVRWMASCWPWTNRKYVCIGVCLNLKMIFVFDTLWGHDFTLMCSPNTLKYRWRLCVYVRCMYDTVSCFLWTNRWCVYGWTRRCYSCPIRYEFTITRWCPVQLPCNRDGGCAFMFVDAWHGVTLTLNKQMVRLFWWVFEFETIIRVRYSMSS